MAINKAPRTRDVAEPRSHHPNWTVVAVGGFCSRIRLLQRLLLDMEPLCAPIVLIDEIPAFVHDSLIHWVKMRTELDVLSARHGQTLQPGRLYVPQPGHIVRFAGNRSLSLLRGVSGFKGRPRQVPFLDSWDGTRGDELLTVLLDGGRGRRHTVAHGCAPGKSLLICVSPRCVDRPNSETLPDHGICAPVEEIRKILIECVGPSRPVGLGS